jgi:glycosyltransferase involved in cell wall biosynthesis
MSASAPFLSVVVPVFNEEACIASFLDRMSAELSRLVPTWEIVVVDDGSTDRTRDIVEAYARDEERIRLLRLDHRGKGAAVKRGLLDACGTWRFMADADLAMPPDNLSRFLEAATTQPRPDLAVGSREAPGARRIGEPWRRHAIGRVFNWLVRCLAVPGIQDTQCGFKLLHAEAVRDVVPHLTVEGFAFDVEMLVLARRAGLTVREVGITWFARDDSRVSLGRGAAAFLDILKIRWRRGRRAGATGQRQVPNGRP